MSQKNGLAIFINIVDNCIGIVYFMNFIKGKRSLGYYNLYAEQKAIKEFMLAN